MKKGLINLPNDIQSSSRHQYYKRFTAGEYYENRLCDIVCDSLQRTITIQFHETVNPFQRIVISKDLLLHLPFNIICGFIRDNFKHPVFFSARDYLSPEFKVRELLRDFSSAKFPIDGNEFNAELSLEQSLAVSLMHIEKLYLNSPMKTNLRREILELSKDYI